jgi:2-dehydropantoate 2-reductase
MKRVCIVGAGAIGGLIGARLGLDAAPGAIELSALARGATLQALQRDGLRLIDAAQPEGRRVALRAAACGDELGEQDLVVIAVKAPALPAVASQVAALLHEHTAVLVAMNGVPWWFFDHASGPCAGLHLASVDAGDVVRSAIPTRHVIGCVVHASAASVAPAVVRHGRGDGLIIGEPAGASTPRTRSVAERLERAGFAVTVSPHIQRDIWFKLWGNMTMNPLSALTLATCDRLLDDPLVRAFASAVMAEAQAIGARFGCDIDQTPDDRHAVTRKLGAFKTSMLQDLEAGRTLELDTLVGAVREIGAHLGLATPNIDTLFGLTRVLGQSKGLYPDAGEPGGPGAPSG